MRIKNFIIPAAAVFLIAPHAVESAFAGADPTGIWLNDTGRGAVQIKPCGNNVCGNVVWVKSTTDASGCGKQIIGDVAPVGGGRWDNGWIYSPEKDRKYDVELTPLANGNLKVVGYAGMKFLSKTMIWKPAPADLQLCGDSGAAKIDANNADASKKSVAATPAPAPASAPTQQASAATSVPPPVDSKPTPATGATDQAKPAPPAETANADPKASEDADKTDDDNGLGALGKLKIGDMSLDKVLTKTKSGKCKLDTPWFKVTLDCPQQ